MNLTVLNVTASNKVIVLKNKRASSKQFHPHWFLQVSLTCLHCQFMRSPRCLVHNFFYFLSLLYSAFRSRFKTALEQYLKSLTSVFFFRNWMLQHRILFYCPSFFFLLSLLFDLGNSRIEIWPGGDWPRSLFLCDHFYL